MHFARHLHTGHYDTKRALSAADKRSTTYMYIRNTNMLFRSHHMYESLPLQPHSPPAPLVTFMHSHHSTHGQPTTDNVLYRTPEATPIGLVYTHLVTSSRVQVVLLHYKLHHISMSFLSCPGDHVVSVIISAVEHGFHSGGKVFDHIDMAPLCSTVQGIASFLQKEKENVKHLSGTGVDMQLCMCEE